MNPAETGRLYDMIASWWNSQQSASTAGLHFVQKAIGFSAKREKALDVGCGSGGRIIDGLVSAGLQVTGIDVSETMVQLATERYPGLSLLHHDICEWQPREMYDVIVAWDSIFHVPYRAQGSVVEKLCRALTEGGAVLFTAGGIDGEISGQMCGQTFYYSSLSEEEYLRILKKTRCSCVLLEQDQYPEDHVVFIAVKAKQA